MDIKDVAGKGFPSRRFVGEQRKLSVRRGVLGQIVDDHQRVSALVAEIFADGEPGEGRDPLQRRRRRGRGDDEDAALGRAPLLDGLDDPLDRRRSLADRDIDADHVGSLLVDDGVDRDRRLAGGAVADDELALAAAEREQGVDHEHAGRHRLLDERAVDDRGRRALDRQKRFSRDRFIPVERPAEGIDDPTQQAGPNRDAGDLAGRIDQRADPDRLGLVEDRRVDRIRVERQGVAQPSALEPQEFAEPASGRPDTWATPSAIASTRPTDWASGLRSRRVSASRSDASQRSPSTMDGVMAGQLLDDALQVFAKAVAHDGVRRLELEPGDHRWIDNDDEIEGTAERAGECVTAGPGFGRSQRPGRNEPRRVRGAECHPGSPRAGSPAPRRGRQ